MNDISKCDGANCPLKYNCYRFTADINPYWQPYIVGYFNPVTGTCDNLWRLDK